MDWLKEAQAAKYDGDELENDESARTYYESAQVSALIALVEEQRETNRLLTAALKMAQHAIQHGDLLGLDDVLDNFTTHPREPWPGPCGTTETPND